MKKFLLILIILLSVIGLSLGGYWIYNNIKENNKEQKILEKQNEIKKIVKQNYSETVKTLKDTKLYCLKDKKYNECGKISKDFSLRLNELKNDSEEYFGILNTEYFINYKDVTPIEEIKESKIRYDKFVPFNETITINNKIKLNKEDSSFIYLDEEINTPIIVKDTDKFGVLINNELFYVNKDDVEVTKTEKNNIPIASKVLTLTYHFIYDPEEKDCNQSICQKIDLFESHLKYLSENNYLTLKMEELEMYLDGKVNIPKNSIVLTIDDGYITEKVHDVLAKYDSYATLFVITGSFDSFDRFYSDHLAVESHTDTMHTTYECKMGLQGGGLLCRDKQKAVEDLKTSQEKLGGNVYYISYPFFDFNNHAIEVVKEAGFKMAFVGQYNTEGYSKPGTDKYKVPRKTVFNTTTVEALKKQLSL